MSRILVPLLIAFALAISATATAQQKKAAPFALKSADGKIYDLSNYSGKVVIVNFWATWCGPCRKEIPDFIELYKRYKDKGLEIIGVSLDQDGWTKVSPFVKQSNINYPVVLGNQKLVDNYGFFNAIPTTFIIDKNGIIVYEHTGTLSRTQLESKLKPLL